MSNVLNLALKKEIFEGLVNNTNNEIPIEKSPWWTKRLMDQDTGRFKKFDVVKASCGSADKVDFNITKIEDRKDKYVVIVSFNNELTKPAKENDAPVQENTKSIEELQQEINKKFLENLIPEKKPYVKPVVEITEGQTLHINEVYKEDNPNKVLKDRIHRLFNSFCSYEKVYVVSTPNVQIRTNGQVVSSGRRVFMNRDYDMNFPFSDMEFVKRVHMTDDDFYNCLKEYLEDMLNGNLVFVKKGSLGVKERPSGEVVFFMKAAFKRIYMFR